MQVAVEKLGGSRVALQIEADTERVTEAYDRAYKEIRRTVPMPGFRKGKAPKQWIRRVVGEEVIDEAARDLLVEDTLKDALEEQDIAALGQPEFDYQELKDGEPFTYTATVVVKPKVELPDYKGIRVEVTKRAITDEMVDEQIESIRQQHAVFAPVTTRGIQNGDFVDLDYYVYEADELPPVGEKRSPMALCVGETWFNPALDEDILGMQVGDTKAILRRLPQTHENEELRGHAVTFDVIIRRIRERIVPEVDDEFAMRVLGVEDVAEMRAEIRGRLEEDERQRSRESAQDRLAARLAAQCDFEVPEPLIEAEVRRRLALWEADLERGGARPDEVLALTGRTRDDLAQQARPAARDTVKRRLVLDALCEAEGIEGEGIDESIETMAASQGVAPEVLRRQLEDAGIMTEVAKDVDRDRALERLYELADKIEVEDLSSEELAWLEGGPEAGVGSPLTNASAEPPSGEAGADSSGDHEEMPEQDEPALGPEPKTAAPETVQADEPGEAPQAEEPREPEQI